MNVVSENGGPVALLEATAEARTLIEELTRLAEELKVRQERLEELLAPSEAALRARTEYLDNVMREHLGRAEQRVLKLGEEVERIVRSLSEHVMQISAQLTEADAWHWSETRRHERRRTIVSLLAMLLGGFLAGQVASYRSGGMANAKPAAVAETKATSKNAPSAPRRAGGPGAKPNAATAR